ncbi:hypothetical protein H2199_006908 [Coniosporium tulheliwenetii]|uniref:Uncharacterized protein n=1 Tax=Coniosporium tulheliwenetii TaxID=3383036 RepID=A0ACC2YSF8_9PEZI|nr:hypothetical protein H2199_006908 [Cladosporium sp. JES 115]
MAITEERKLHWTQRLALVRHNLHAARRTGDFTFFKTLQVHAFLDNIDYVAVLTANLGDEADTVLATLDNLNAGIAYVHQDAFKNVYDSAKAIVCADNGNDPTTRAKICVDACQQSQIADFAIDKMSNSARNFIESQPPACQDAIANVLITGTTIIADAIKVCMVQTERIESTMGDFLRLEYSWQTVQAAVDSTVGALRGIFCLMAVAEPESPPSPVEQHHSPFQASSVGMYRPRLAPVAPTPAVDNENVDPFDMTPNSTVSDYFTTEAISIDDIDPLQSVGAHGFPSMAGLTRRFSNVYRPSPIQV